jgi:hypothetical protein
MTGKTRENAVFYIAKTMAKKKQGRKGEAQKIDEEGYGKPHSERERSAWSETNVMQNLLG